ncbi:uncharacterized protein LOC123448639 [Hordeum vulgare subsp. vulgare]|uniref:Predicted protein n=1 Tax=Hordeum vulgare subsp. vulgare TaxID=112509 RepID=F2D9U2_HORVV|nr:uncharacterized protein LOC123448639 [Hordeum vulgare subsp. vulgare]BAJ91863.1 predicted protein [Hordeum vulgare subsp. vulgare]
MRGLCYICNQRYWNPQAGLPGHGGRRPQFSDVLPGDPQALDHPHRRRAVSLRLECLQFLPWRCPHEPTLIDSSFVAMSIYGATMIEWTNS